MGLKDLLSMLELLVKSFGLKKENLANSKTPELYATYAAYRKVAEGMSFRDAYRQTATELKEGKIKPEDYKQEYELAVTANHASAQVALKAELKKQIASLGSEKARLAKIEADIFQAKQGWGKLFK